MFSYGDDREEIVIKEKDLACAEKSFKRGKAGKSLSLPLSDIPLAPLSVLFL